jgi:outer membrane protein TolC
MTFPHGLWLGLSVAILCFLSGSGLAAQQSLQQPLGLAPPQASGPNAQSYQGSVTVGTATGETLNLTLDEAIQRGLKNNLGILLSGTQTAANKGQRLSALQSLLPELDASLKDTVSQVDLPAEGLRIPGFPTIIGPFGYQDLRASLTWSLINVSSLRKYMAAKHNFSGSQLSADDARDLVILTVGNAYLLVLADESQVASVEAQVATSKVSLDQAVDNHQAGTAPMLDELRAKVDYQSLQQQDIVAKNSLEKDKLALARTIGLPLAQKFDLADKAPYAAFDHLDVDATIREAHANRKDLASMVEQVKAAEDQRKAATADRFPTLSFSGDYGDIGVNLLHSHETFDTTGTISVPLFAEFALRGEAEVAQSQLDVARDQLSDKNAQIDADIRDALLDIESAQQQVEVAKSSSELANEALKEAQERYANGVSDNLAVSQAEQSVAQADSQYVASLYRHNVAKLSLARALGAGQNYYLGGK